ncbi:MAG: hypothetical protein ACREER_10915 [Alphaproteobacteria bacterium]
MDDPPARHGHPPAVVVGAGLKILVIVMAVMIAAGIAVLGITIVQRSGEADFGIADHYATATVPLPAGSRVLDMAGDGDVLTLLVEAADGGQSLVTVDRRSGTVLGTLSLAARP